MRGSKRYMKITFSISFSWNNKIEATQNEVESHFKCGSNLSFFCDEYEMMEASYLKVDVNDGIYIYVILVTEIKKGSKATIIRSEMKLF